MTVEIKDNELFNNIFHYTILQEYPVRQHRNKQLKKSAK